MNPLQSSLFSLIRRFFVLLGTVPRHRHFRWADVLGSIWFAVDRRHRKVAVENLTRAFGHEMTPADRMQLARTVFRNLALMPLEIAWSLRLDEKELLGHFEIRGFSHVEAAWERGRGVLLLTAHTGNWELLPVPLVRAGYPLNIIYRPLDFQPAEAFFREYRTRFGAKLLPKKKSMRKIIRSLANGECVGVLLDQDAGLTAGVFVPFFGQKACTNKGLALLALKTKAPVVPAFIARRQTGFVVECGEEMPLIDTGDANRDVISNTLQYNRAIEAFVRRHPAQWFWVHRRWKNRYAHRLKKKQPGRHPRGRTGQSAAPPL